MWYKKSLTLLRQVKRMPEWCRVDLEQKPWSSFQASLFAARMLTHDSHLTTGALGSIRGEKNKKAFRIQRILETTTTCFPLCRQAVRRLFSALAQLSPLPQRWWQGPRSLWALPEVGVLCAPGRVGSCQHLFSFTCKPQQAPTRPRRGRSSAPRASWEIWLSETNGAFFQKHGHWDAHSGTEAGPVRTAQISSALFVLMNIARSLSGLPSPAERHPLDGPH